VQFSQECMNVDRDSCYYAAYNATSFDEGIKVINTESIAGAVKSSNGAGWLGNFTQDEGRQRKL
jgi:hypothetical protein